MDSQDCTRFSGCESATYGPSAALVQAFKALVWEKSQGRCWYCGRQPNPFLRDYQMDHVIPRERGGLDTLDNRVPACQPCNARKHDSTLEEYRQRMGGGRFWFERQNLGLEVNEPAPLLDSSVLLQGWSAVTQALQGTQRVTRETRWERLLINILRRDEGRQGHYPDFPLWKLQQNLSGYGCRKGDLARLLATMVDQGRVCVYKNGRATFVRWTGV
jgi:HNH endonuclease